MNNLSISENEIMDKFFDLEDSEEMKFELEAVSMNGDIYQSRRALQETISITKQNKVESEEDYNNLTKLYARCRDVKKKVEAERKSLTEPLRKQMTAINDKAKTVTEPLDELIELLNFQASCYQKMLENKAKKEAEELKAKSFLLDLMPEEIFVPVPQKTISQEAVTVTKTVKKFRVLDVHQIPMQYMKPNEDLIEQHIKLGITEIPGIEVYEETTTQLRVK